MRPVNNPYGGVNPLIDKMIGNAYDIVKYVARYLKEIRYVAENMEHVFIAANGNRVILTGTASGASLNIPLPNGLVVADIQSITVQALDGGALFLPGSSTFSFGVFGGQVAITISNSSLNDAVFQVMITTAEPVG